ncbi:hypothetical protein Goarm_011489, partial [Gossypium armourianum]|nr:hypothetical protein [Gossypium armourianum]
MGKCVCVFLCMWLFPLHAGPLGQGIANMVGRNGSCRETLGSCLLTGHWGLGKLIAFYDDNRISIDGDTKIAFTERIDKHFEGLRWHVIWSRMGTLAMMKFVPLLRKQMLSKTSPLLTFSKCFHSCFLIEACKNCVVQQVLFVEVIFPSHSSRGAALEAEWDAKFVEDEKKYREETVELNLIITGELPAGWEKALSLLNSVKHDTPKECNVRFRVREHGMGAICNGIALHSPGLIPYSDGNEITGAYKVVVFKRKTPSILALSKKALEK